MGWFKDPNRHLDVVPTDQRPEACRHNGGRSTHVEDDGTVVVNCTECNSYWTE